MARRPRIRFPGALYHVIAKGNRRQDVFLDEQDLKKFLAGFLDFMGRQPFLLHAYILNNRLGSPIALPYFLTVLNTNKAEKWKNKSP